MDIKGGKSGGRSLVLEELLPRVESYVHRNPSKQYTWTTLTLVNWSRHRNSDGWYGVDVSVHLSSDPIRVSTTGVPSLRVLSPTLTPRVLFPSRSWRPGSDLTPEVSSVGSWTPVIVYHTPDKLGRLLSRVENVTVGPSGPSMYIPPPC